VVDRKLRADRWPVLPVWTIWVDLCANHVPICHSTGLSSPSSRKSSHPYRPDKMSLANNFAQPPGEPAQRCLLVPLLLHLQVCFPAVARSPHLQVCPVLHRLQSMPPPPQPENMSDSAIGVPRSFSAPSWPPRSAVTSGALPLLACVPRPTRPSKRLAPQDLSINRGRAWSLKATKGYLLGSQSVRMKPLRPSISPAQPGQAIGASGYV